jgi:RES domain-containing protein
VTGTVWRIVTHRFAASAFSGEGARLFGGRWNRKGESVVYTAQSRSLAFLEMLVQDEPLRANYVLIPAEIPGDIARLKIDSMSCSHPCRESTLLGLSANGVNLNSQPIATKKHSLMILRIVRERFSRDDAPRLKIVNDG